MRASTVFERLYGNGAHAHALIVGKGPSFTKERVEAERARGRVVIGINEVGNELLVTPDATVFNDFGVFGRFSPYLVEKGPWFITAAYRSMRSSKTSESVEFIIRNAEIFLKLQQRMAYFDARFSAFQKWSEPPPLQVWNTTAETCVHLLGKAGFKDVMLIGVDGGTKYAPEFADQEEAGINYDMQWRPLKWAIDCYPGMVVHHYERGPL